MINRRRLLVIVLVAIGHLPARAADVAPLNRPNELYASALRDSGAPSATAASQDVSIWPPKPPDAVLPPQPTLTAQLYQPNVQPNIVQTPPPYQPQPQVATVLPVLPAGVRLVESTWYTRIDYMHWNERLDGANFVTENGPLFTIGYQRRVGQERFRAELFGSQVSYASTVFFNDGSSQPLNSTTDYLGGRAEYDYLFDPEWPTPIVFFGGIGSRFWIRNLPDSVLDGETIRGYQETWWTIYPYLGMETRHDETRDVEFYGRGRIGLVAVTYEHLTLDETTLFPGPGVTGQMELGFRGEFLFLAGYFEAFTWRQSGESRGFVQPSSLLVTVGLKTGITF
jgi:hypothetical protein